MAAVLLGMPFPWADNIQLHIHFYVKKKKKKKKKRGKE